MPPPGATEQNMAEMPTGEPDSPQRRRAADPDVGLGDATDFLGLRRRLGQPGHVMGVDDAADEDFGQAPAYAEEHWAGAEDELDPAEAGGGAWPAEAGAWDGQEAPPGDPSTDPFELEDGALLEDGLEPELDLDFDDFDLEEADAASWLMELDESELDGGLAGEPHLSDPYGDDHELPRGAQRPSSFWLAAVVCLSVGAGVALSRFVSRIATPAGEELAIRTPVTEPEPAPAPAGDVAPGTQPDPVAAAEPDATGEPGFAPAPEGDALAQDESGETDPAPGRPGSEPTLELQLAALTAPLAAQPAAPEPEPALEPEPEPEPVPRPPTSISSSNPAVTEPVGTTEPETPGRLGLLHGLGPIMGPIQPAPPEPFSPLSTRRGPVREATPDDLANIWMGTTIPLDAMDREPELLTPNVGRVRVLIRQGDYFEGRLHAVGHGKVWLQSGRGKMALMAWQIQRIEHVLGNDSSPTPGMAGSQELAGLPSVRVRAPGGVFYGKLLSQQDGLVTLMTAEGARISLERGVVEPAGRSTTRVIDLVE